MNAADRPGSDRATVEAALAREGVVASEAELAALVLAHARRREAIEAVRAWLAALGDVGEAPP